MYLTRKYVCEWYLLRNWSTEMFYRNHQCVGVPLDHVQIHNRGSSIIQCSQTPSRVLSCLDQVSVLIQIHCVQMSTCHLSSSFLTGMNNNNNKNQWEKIHLYDWYVQQIYLEIGAHFSFFKVNERFRIFHKSTELIGALLTISNLAVANWISVWRNLSNIVILALKIPFVLICFFLEFGLFCHSIIHLFSLIICVCIVILHVDLLILTLIIIILRDTTVKKSSLSLIVESIIISVGNATVWIELISLVVWVLCILILLRFCKYRFSSCILFACTLLLGTQNTLRKICTVVIPEDVILWPNISLIICFSLLVSTRITLVMGCLRVFLTEILMWRWLFAIILIVSCPWITLTLIRL